MAAMRMLDFGTFPVWTNVAIFAGAAVVVWIAGTRLARYADEISDRTKLSKAFLGLILLAVATSLPEIATTITAALLENAALVTGNLFGGAMFSAALGMVVTCIYLVGLLERHDKTVLRMGYDSVAVLGAYVLGLVGLYFLGSGEQ